MSNLNRELIKSFIIGSSFAAFIIFFIGVTYFFYVKEAVFNYFKYSIRAPIYLGVVSMVAKLLSIKYNIPLKKSYFIMSIISALLTNIYVSVGRNPYNFKTKERWYFQYLIIFISHIFVYNKIIYPLDIYL